MRLSPVLAIAACLLIVWAAPARGSDIQAAPALLCRAAIAATEAATRIPEAFLSAIGRVESGRSVPAIGTVAPWPWTVNAAGEGHYYASKEEAIAAVQQFQASGIRSLDIGCLQVNIMYHPEAFASLAQAFDPMANAAYAARLLMSLHEQTGSWPRAAAAYHSQTPALGEAYQKQVLAAWAEPDKDVGSRETRAVHTSALAVKVPMPETVAAPVRVMGPSMPSNTLFTRNMRLPPAPGAIGRTLAAYRAMPVQFAAGQPSGSFARN